MKTSLTRKLSLAFIFAVLGSIILASAISNYSVGNKFKNYLVDEQKTKAEEVVSLIDNLFSTNPEPSEDDFSQIQRYAELQKFYVEVQDKNNKTIYSSGKSYLQDSSNMSGMMSSMMGNNNGNYQYTENNYPLSADNKEEGTIIIGYFENSYYSSASVSFISTLNHSFILSAGIALIFGIIISIIISRQISKPLSTITNTANDMRNGNLDVRVNVNSNTKEIIELSDSINYLAASLNSQEMLRKRLTSDMAHELRTPLTTLKTHIEAFLDGVWEPTKERFETFYQEIERMTKMVDNLRDLAKLEQTNINLSKKKVNLSKELKKIVDTFKILYIKKKYQLNSSITPDIIYEIDLDKFKQIMNNLLSNSYKYLQENGKANVILKSENGRIIIKISDNGIGIPKKDLPYIFERFYRSDISRNKNTGGSGIGLTITKAFVEAHGGKISLDSIEGEGTTFTIEFPENPKKNNDTN